MNKTAYKVIYFDFEGNEKCYIESLSFDALCEQHKDFMYLYSSYKLYKKTGFNGVYEELDSDQLPGYE